MPVVNLFSRSVWLPPLLSIRSSANQKESQQKDKKVEDLESAVMTLCFPYGIVHCIRAETRELDQILFGFYPFLNSYFYRMPNRKGSNPVIPHNHPFRLKYQYGAIPDNTMAHRANG